MKSTTTSTNELSLVGATPVLAGRRALGNRCLSIIQNELLGYMPAVTLMNTYRTLAEAVSAHDSRNERPFLCPVHDDTNASASVNVDKGLWYCYTCKAKGKTDGIYVEPTISLQEINDLLTEARTIPESAYALYVAGEVHPYWLARFTEDAARHFQLGYDPESKKPCYPIRDINGELLGICTRSIDGSPPKYKYPSGVKVSNLIFNHQLVERETIILVEGAMDVVACYEAGHDAWGIYGSAFSEKQLQLVLSASPDRVVLGFDNDPAGRDCTAKVARLCRFHGIDTVAIPWYLHDYNDLAELPRQDRANLLDTLVTSPTMY
jgi:hypothetical protein